MRGLGALTIVVCLFLVPLGAGAAWGAQSPAAPAPCTIDLTLSPRSRDAEVNSTRPIAVSFTGDYTVDLPPVAERASVTFTAAVDAGWAATVSPATATVTSQARSGTVSVTVVVPAASRPGDVGTLTVTARMVAAGLQCQDQDTGAITPLPYLDDISGKITPAGVQVKNGVGSFTLSLGVVASVPVVIALEYFGPDGAAISGPATVTLPDPAVAAPNASVNVRIQAPGLAEGTYQLEVRLNGTASGGLSKQGAAYAPLTVSAGGAPVFSSSLLPLVAAVAVVGAALYLWKRR
jgi:hypothetical protein